MNAIAAMRGAGDGKLLVAKPERIGGAALDQRNGLQSFDGGARKYRAFDLAKRQHATASRVGNSDRPGVAALDELSPHHFDEHGIG
jgi:hypothetical protein